MKNRTMIVVMIFAIVLMSGCSAFTGEPISGYEKVETSGPGRKVDAEPFSTNWFGILWGNKEDLLEHAYGGPLPQ